MFLKVSHILVSLMVLISTTGLTVDKHYCGENLVSVNLFGDAKSCGETDGSCCRDEASTYKLAVDYVHPVFVLSFTQVDNLIPVCLSAHDSMTLPGFSMINRFGLSPPKTLQNTLSSLQAYRL